MPRDPDASPARRLPAPAPASPAAGDEFARLVEIMRLLRSPDGCPWDREQTWLTLAPFVLEEAYEVVDAIEREDGAELKGEIGDLIFEGVFLAQLAAEADAFTAADAVRSVSEKLIRRHPHVFATAGPAATGAAVSTAGQVVEQWQDIKTRERAVAGKPEPGPLDGIPRALPALLAAFEIGKRAAKVGFDWARPNDVLDKVEEEVSEFRLAVERESPERAAEELGDLLFALANLSRKLGIEPEAALRAANRKFVGRFRAMHDAATAEGARFEELTLDEMEARWQAVKKAGAPPDGA